MRLAARSGAALALGGMLAVTACGGSSAAEASPEVVVFAAASLTDSFTQISADFQAANAGTSVTVNFGPSSGLAQQILSGAPADVFASANPETMELVTDTGGGDGEPEIFVRNRLEIVVPAGNPGSVEGLADFADEELTIALCAEQVPCGGAALQAFEAAGITPAPDTLEQDVRAALTKVVLGEVDAALVYRTDVIAGGDQIEGIEFPEADQAVNDYPIALLGEAANPRAGQAFIDYVLSPDGQAVLVDAGFLGARE